MESGKVALSRTPTAPKPEPSDSTAYADRILAERKAMKLKLSFYISILVGVVLVILTVFGIIDATIAAVIFAFLIVGMLVFHGGVTAMISGVSDHEGYEKQLEEEEQRKAEEAEYFGEEHHDAD
ncbi:MAG: hypothetical protein V1744_01185 [Candidatus Altiarchaeota archaeon]